MKKLELGHPRDGGTHGFLRRRFHRDYERKIARSWRWAIAAPRRSKYFPRPEPRQAAR